jgi:hypothetical protein
MIIGILIALLIAGFAFLIQNSEAHDNVHVAISRGYVRVYAYTLIAISLGGLFGLFVRLFLLSV